MWYNADMDKIEQRKAKIREYQKKNPEKYRAATKKYYEKNKAKIAARKALWFQKKQAEKKGQSVVMVELGLI